MTTRTESGGDSEKTLMPFTSPPRKPFFQPQRPRAWTLGSVWDFRPALLTRYFLVTWASFFFCQHGPLPCRIVVRSKNRASEAAGPEQATGAQQVILGSGGRHRTGDKLHTLPLSLGGNDLPFLHSRPSSTEMPAGGCPCLICF